MLIKLKYKSLLSCFSVESLEDFLSFFFFFEIRFPKESITRGVQASNFLNLLLKAQLITITILEL